MGKLVVRRRARLHLDRIYASIAADNPAAADRVVGAILDKARRAADMPGIGPLRPKISPTARILVHGRYVAIYEPIAGGIQLIAVVHTARDPASWLDPL